MMAGELFHVIDQGWIGAFIGGKPVLCPAANDKESMDGNIYASARATFSAEVTVFYDPEGGFYDHFGWFADALGASTSYAVINENTGCPPGDGTVTVAPIHKQNGVPIPPAMTMHLMACSPGQDPDDGTSVLHSWVDQGAIYYEPHLAPPTRYAKGGEFSCKCGDGGTPSPDPSGLGTLGLSSMPVPAAVDEDGRLAVYFVLPVAPAQDPNVIMTAFTYLSNESRWTFSALPGDLAFGNSGQTREDPPRDHWFAGIASASGGGGRAYHSDASDGDFVPELDFGTAFASNGTAFIETIGAAKVHYDSNHRIVGVQDGGAIHTYSYLSGSQVEIKANTYPQSKMVCTHAGYQVSSVRTYVEWPEVGWVEVGSAGVEWEDDLIQSIELAPSGTTTSFIYYDDGSLRSFESCSGAETELQYHAGGD